MEIDELSLKGGPFRHMQPFRTLKDAPNLEINSQGHWGRARGLT